MNTKLIVASFAAMAHLGAAVKQIETTDTTTVTETVVDETAVVVEQVETASVASQLIEIYDSCQVSVDALNMNVRQDYFNTIQETDVVFSLSNTEGCPDMLMTVWFELPEGLDHTHADVPDQEYTLHYEPAEVMAIAGDGYLHTFTTLPISGDYVVHVSLSPYGFECGLSITEECQDVPVILPCGAEFVDSAFEFSTAKRDVDFEGWNIYGTEGGLQHIVDWSVRNTWNCDLTVNVNVANDVNDFEANYSYTWEQALNFIADPDSHTVFHSPNQWSEMTVTWELYDHEKDVV